MRRSGTTRDASDTVAVQLAWMFGLGLPLVALAHVGIGAFLAMQSYFGGTFADGTGAVVGVGLLRNLASLMSGLVLIGMLAARMTTELRLRVNASQRPDDGDSGSFARLPDGSFVRRDRAPETSAPVDARALRVRMLAATLAGPTLGFWGAAIGTIVGWQVAHTMMGVSNHSFFSMFWDMLWARDLLGMVVKGLLFGFFAGVFACHEGLRGAPEDGLPEFSAAGCRAACGACVGMLIVNSAWFILAFHAGPAFGPTLLESPAL
jgi:phospholipid/cholesterol/gamma-HCH transport system permease protein